MPKILAAPLARPATPGVTIPANHTQKTKTGQSPGKPATTHKIPSCGVIQITHKPTNEKFICSTADVKKTLRNIYTGCTAETAISHPKLISCFNGGNASTTPKVVCGGYPTAGGFNSQGNYSLPVYTPQPIRVSGGGGGGGLAGPCFVGAPHTFDLPQTTKTNIKIGYAGGSTTKGGPSISVKPADYFAGVSKPAWNQVGPSPRPTSKNTWEVGWLCRFDRGTVDMNNLIKYEIAFKEAVQPMLNGDRGSSTISRPAPGGGTVTTRYNFCGTGGTGGGGTTKGGTSGGFCGTPVRGGGGIGVKPVITRGNHVKQVGGGTVANSGGRGVPILQNTSDNCCNSGGNAYDFDRRQNPVTYLPGFETIKKFTPGPYAETRGGRMSTQKKMRNYEKSITQNCGDRNKQYPSLPSIPSLPSLPKCPVPGGTNVKMAGSRLEGRNSNVTRSMAKR